MSDMRSFCVRIVNVRPKSNAYAVDSGEFSFKEDILGQLPRYFKYIDMMRKVDVDAYEMFSGLGASLMPNNKYTMTDSAELASEHYTVDEVPTFGCLYLPVRDDDKDKVFCDFIWWRKLNGSLPGVESSQGATVFHVSALYHDADKELLPMSYSIAAPSMRDMRVLKEFQYNKSPMYDHKSQKERRAYSIGRNEWSFPRVLKHVAAENKKDIHKMGVGLFLIAMTAVMSRKSGFQVRVAKGGRYAVFNVDDNVSSGFFRDRDVQVNDNGRTKKIFHFVPGYQRLDGVSVRPHTKGLREFDWNGYSVHIGKPNFDFANPELLRVEGDVYNPEVRSLTMAEVGVMMQRHIRTNGWNKAKRRKKRK